MLSAAGQYIFNGLNFSWVAEPIVWSDKKEVKDLPLYTS